MCVILCKSSLRLYSFLLLSSIILVSCGGGGGDGDGGLKPPELSSIGEAFYTENITIEKFSFSNSGGGLLTSCTADTLAVGLSLSISSDGNTCEITGTPTVFQEPGFTYITAKNAAGSSFVMVQILVMRGVPTLSLDYDQIKTFQFSWGALGSADHYRLMENSDGSSGFVEIASISSASQSFAHVIPLYKRMNAQYVLQICYLANNSYCMDSNTVSVSSALINSIGYIKASNSDAGDSFSSVALSGDGNTLAVGASAEDSNATGINGNQADNTATDSGAVYIFSRDGSSWLQQAYIKASNANADDRFSLGYISLSDDGNTLAVGAAQEDSNATGINGDQTSNSAENSGAVYIFTRSDTNWTQQAYLKASNTNDLDYFGLLAILSGDGNTLAVAARGEDSGATGINGDQLDNSASTSGAVYVFNRTGSNWLQQAYIKASNTGAGDDFGLGLALSDDGNTLAVGAYFEDSNSVGINGAQSNDLSLDSGAVYVFSRTGSSWLQQAYIKASNAEAGDYYGRELDLSDDGNTLAVGSFGEGSNATGVQGDQSDNSLTGSGAAYVYTRSGSSWLQEAYIKASNTDAADAFGASVKLSGDGNILAIGAYKEDSNALGINGDQTNNSSSSSGAVYIFNRSSSNWLQQAYIKAGNTDESDWFSNIISISDDGETLAIGAMSEDSNATGVGGNQADNSTGPGANFGAVYLY